MARISILVLSALLLLLGAHAALAASITIVPTAAGTYSLQGDGMDGVAGINLTINYNSALLSAPSVSQGRLVSGAMMAANTASSGTVRIAIISTRVFSGSGQVATLTFAGHNGGGGGLTSATVSMINSKGATVASSVAISGGTANTADSSSGLITSPGVPFTQSNETTATQSSATAAPVASVPNDTVTVTTSSATATAATSAPMMPGTVSLPAEMQPGSDAKTGSDAKPSEPAPAHTPEPAEAAPASSAPGPAPSAENKPIEDKKVRETTYKSVLETFRTYTGEKFPAILTGFFEKNNGAPVRQEPVVALSDGTTPLKLAVTLNTGGDASPNFALNGARMVSLYRDASPNTWIVEVVPPVGAMEVDLTIMTRDEIIYYPLALAPPVAGVSAVESDFVAFLADSRLAVTKRDLNGDGKHTYVDDYIYAANYLVRKGGAGKKNK